MNTCREVSRAEKQGSGFIIRHATLPLHNTKTMKSNSENEKIGTSILSLTNEAPLTTNEDEALIQPSQPKLGCFAKWLTLWIFLAMAIGTTIGAVVPSIPEKLQQATVFHIWLPGIILVWIMIYPMMLGVRWHSIRVIHKNPKGLLLTTTVNWAVQPFLMYGLAVLFFEVIYASLLDEETQKQYIAGSVILGGSPCTAMVFVWSSLAHGDPSYTLVQVVLNDLILLFLYVPTVQLLLHVSDISLPWGTVFLSVALFVVVPFFFGIATYAWIFHQSGEHGEETLERIKRALSTASASALIILVVFIFMSQAQVLIGNFVNVFLIIVPLILQTAIVFCVTYSIAYFICLEHNIAGPAAFIGSSNFFELAVALALTVYGADSGAVLVTVCGVLVEVPVMLCEVAIVNATKGRYEQRLADESCGCDNKDEGSRNTSSIRLGREDDNA